MNREETLAIMGVLKAAYPNYYRDMKRGDAEGVVELWHTMFADDPAQVVGMAVKAHIATDTKGFPPHIGAIKESIRKLTQPKEMTEQEAWALVRQATRNGIYGSQDEFDRLPHSIQKLVGSPNQLREWAMMDGETLNSVVASNFQRSYKVVAAREREMLTLPHNIRVLLDEINTNKEMPQLTDGTNF